MKATTVARPLAGSGARSVDRQSGQRGRGMHVGAAVTATEEARASAPRSRRTRCRVRAGGAGGGPVLGGHRRTGPGGRPMSSAAEDVGVDDVERRAPASRRHRSSAMIRVWFASVSYVAPPMCGVSTTDGKAAQRVVGGQGLPFEVVESGGGHLARLQRGDQRRRCHGGRPGPS